VCLIHVSNWFGVASQSSGSCHFRFLVSLRLLVRRWLVGSLRFLFSFRLVVGFILLVSLKILKPVKPEFQGLVLNSEIKCGLKWLVICQNCTLSEPRG
jgi:hypothetical protein